MTEPAATVKTVPFDPEAKPAATVNQNNHATNANADDGKPVVKTQEELDHEAAMIKKAEAGTNTATQNADGDLFAGKYKTKEEFDKAILSAYHKKHGDKVEDAFKQLAGDLSNESNTNTNDSKTPEEIAAEKVIADKAAADAAAAAADTRTDAQKAADAAKEKADADASADTRTDAQKTADAAKELADKEAADAQTGNNDDAGNEMPRADMENFVQEFNKDGKLSDDSYGKLDEAGFDKSMVDTYMAGITVQRDALFEIVGGKENFFQMTEWASEDGGMSEAEINVFNEDLNTGEPVRMQRAVNTLKTAFDASGKKTAPGTRIEPKEVNTVNGVTGYSHIDQLKADQKNPEYKKSAAFRAIVKEKIRLGTI